MPPQQAFGMALVQLAYESRRQRGLASLPLDADGTAIAAWPSSAAQQQNDRLRESSGLSGGLIAGVDAAGSSTRL